MGLSKHPRHREVERIAVGKFLATDVEGIESVGTVGAVFEQVFLALGELFAGLVLVEAVAATAHSG